MKQLTYLLSFFFFSYLTPSINAQTLQWNDKHGPWNIRRVTDISVGRFLNGEKVTYVGSQYEGLLKTTDGGNNWSVLLPALLKFSICRVHV